ncbi:restriction endonuclease subunit S [Ectothiorhodospira mobilis]|uniref:restriction endonuclease subunit S n=1 Tax=Ectothiorhodospira mobilis TaxID=195064 RepID=UPI001EE909F5|nr:restriction endonuclease subunit S [Ectothiorhodospira mobilis]MCG5535951.1 restriction endonuclease subunit S [Ectothiorhodospira mobilis]
MTVSVNQHVVADEQASHWKERKLKFISDVRTSNVDKHIVECEIPVRLCNYTDVYYNEKITPGMPFMQGSATESEIERFGLKKGQVLLTKDSESWEDIAVPAYVTETMPEVVCGYHLAVIEPDSDEVDGRFLSWLAQSPVLNDQFKLAAKGVTRFGLSQYALKNAVIEVPSLEYQSKVAAFLDRKTAEIDTLIAKKRRLLDLLAEKRTALITRTVTKGLNPDAPMKDSGIEWLGEIPAHWSVQPVYTRYSVQLGKMLDERRITGDSLIRYLRNVDIQWDKINYEGLPKMDIGESEYERYLVEEGDLLVCEGGEIGRSAIVGEQLEFTAYQKALHRLRPIHEAEHPRYMFYTLFAAAKNGVLSVGGVSTISHLTAEQLKRLRFPTPPGNEQRRIANCLDRSLVELDEAYKLVDAAIEQLHEYRSALITNAVTGQIQVA